MIYRHHLQLIKIEIILCLNAMISSLNLNISRVIERKCLCFSEACVRAESRLHRTGTAQLALSEISALVMIEFPRSLSRRPELGT